MLRSRAAQGSPRAARPDPVVSLAVILGSILAMVLLLGGVLAVYDYSTPGVELPLFWVGLGLFLAAVSVQVVAFTVRALRRNH